MKEKLMSRKLWAAIAGIATGIGLIVSGNVTQGTAVLVSSIVGYIVAEGLIDAAAASSVLEIVDETEIQMEEEDE